MTILESLLQVTIAGLVLGAGLPILFGVGIRLWVPATDGSTNSATNTAADIAPWRRATAVVIFGIIALAIVIGLLWVTQGRIYTAFGWDIFGTAGQGGGH